MLNLWKNIQGTFQTILSLGPPTLTNLFFRNNSGDLEIRPRSGADPINPDTTAYALVRAKLHESGFAQNATNMFQLVGTKDLLGKTCHVKGYLDGASAPTGMTTGEYYIGSGTGNGVTKGYLYIATSSTTIEVVPFGLNPAIIIPATGLSVTAFDLAADWLYQYDSSYGTNQNWKRKCYAAGSTNLQCIKVSISGGSGGGTDTSESQIPATAIVCRMIINVKSACAAGQTVKLKCVKVSDGTDDSGVAGMDESDNNCKATSAAQYEIDDIQQPTVADYVKLTIAGAGTNGNVDGYVFFTIPLS